MLMAGATGLTICIWPAALGGIDSGGLDLDARPFSIAGDLVDMGFYRQRAAADIAIDCDAGCRGKRRDESVARAWRTWD